MAPPRVLVVSEIPTPYRLPLYARLAAGGEIDLEVVFCARSEPDRPWEIGRELDAVPHRFLRGVSPSVRTRRGTFVYQINPGAIPLAGRGTFDVAVVGGYSVFSEQVTIALASVRRLPYVLHSESTLLGPRPFPIRLAKKTVVAPLVRGAAAGLATGSAAAAYLERYGLPSERIRIVPNTIDVVAYGLAASDARARDAEVRREAGLPERFVLFAGRLVEDKGILDLLEAYRLGGASLPPLVVAGEGVLEETVRTTPNVIYRGFVQPDRLIDLYALAEWAVVPSHHEPWGVVVNEALACGCPVIASDRVGAVPDLVEDGINGRIVPAGSPPALAAVLAGPRPSGDPARGTIERWTYAYGADQFLEAVELALARKRSAR